MSSNFASFELNSLLHPKSEPVSPLLNLPIELLELVTGNLPAEDLFSLVQTNASLAFWLIKSAIRRRIDEDQTLLHHAAKNGDASAVRHLLELEKDNCIEFICSKDRLGCTPLHLAAESSPSVVRVLLQKKADINSRNKAGETALFCAVEAGRADIVKVLLENGADIDVRDSTKQLTALEKAVMYGKEDVVQCLMGNEARAVSQDEVEEKENKEKESVYGKGEYASLAHATSSGFVEAVAAMIKKGMNPFRHNRAHKATGGCPALAVITCWRNGGSSIMAASCDEDGNENGNENVDDTEKTNIEIEIDREIGVDKEISDKFKRKRVRSEEGDEEKGPSKHLKYSQR